MKYDKIILKDLKIGDHVLGYLLLTKLEEKVSSRGTKYCEMTLLDGVSSPIRAKVWSGREELSVTPTMIIGVDMKCDEYNGAPSYVINKCGTAAGCDYDIRDFILAAPLESEMMFDAILKLVDESIGGKKKSNGTLAGLTRRIYEKNKDKLMMWSAAETIHHNMYGGLLYHTYRMVQQAQVLAKVYPSLNAEVLLSATALHDIGKLEELETDEMGNATYTVDGRLLGHAYIGMRMVEEEAKNGDYDPEAIRCLLHCISAHHGKLEWGAICLPQTEEAAMLHYIDLIDSRVIQFENAAEMTEPGKMSDNKIFGLDNIRVYHPDYSSDNGETLD